MVAMDILEELEKVPQQPEDLASCDLLGFDTETTGLGPGSSIISASLVLRDRKSGEDKVENFLLNPHAPIDPGAAAVNGFTQEFVEKNGGDQKEGLEKMAKAIILAQLKGIPLVAYNAKFDVSMLKSDLEKVGRGDLAEKLSRLSVLDPLVFDRALSRRPGKRKLENAMEWWGVSPRGGYHDAQVDTQAALDLMCTIAACHPEIPLPAMEWQRKEYGKWAESWNRWAEEKGAHKVEEEWGL
ncbi:MAG: DNA polymerase III subunit epsilon [Aeriscardovia sp.]|nr:DNA polymerase III subunit epsilon [Aeriscardovia sp.]